MIVTRWSLFLAIFLVVIMILAVIARAVPNSDIIVTSPWVDVRAYNGDLEAACNASHGKKVLVSSQTTTLLSSYSTPTDVQISVVNGGLISQGSFTLTINGPFTADLYTVFSGTGGIVFGNDTVQYVFPSWWGVTGTNDEVAINAAINSIPNGGTVFLTAGSYNIQTNPVQVKQGITLTGPGGGINGAGAVLNTSLSNQGMIRIMPGAHQSTVSNLLLRSVSFPKKETC